MRLPIIKSNNIFKKSMVAFGGLNLMQNFSDGEMCECIGISHLKYPAITQRQKSEKVFACSSPTAAAYGNKECIAASGALYYDRKMVAKLSAGKKQLVIMGNKVIVFPDKVYYDTETEQLGDLQGECMTGGTKVTFSSNSISVEKTDYVEKSLLEYMEFPSDAQIITYKTAESENGNFTFSGFSLTEAQSLTEGVIFREKCDVNQYRKVMSIEISSDGKICTAENELITVENRTKDIFSALKEGDVVEISGCVSNPKNNLSAQIVSKTESSLVFSGEIFTQASETENITIKRKIPDFTCVCSYENRLWGCEGNTVYASALGDATNFFVYKNLSTDSFTVQSNTPGDFTACISYGNCCLFFKENACFKLYGNRPANFQLTESFGSGILKSDASSIVNINGRIIYKGSSGVFVFYGGIPQCISQKLGDTTMENAVAGSDGKRYYITADTAQGREEFVWDMEKNLWSKSGETDTLGYSFYGGNMYRLTATGLMKICEQADCDCRWSITLCPFDEDYYKTKNYSRLHVHARLFENAWLRVEISRDDEAWKTVSTSYADEMKYLNIPCMVKNCHSVRIRLSGKGRCILESITREFSIN